MTQAASLASLLVAAALLVHRCVHSTRSTRAVSSSFPLRTPALLSRNLAGHYLLYLLLILVCAVLCSGGSWTDWSDWSLTCTGHESRACGSGTQTRARTCPASDPSCNTAEELTQTETRACASCGAPLRDLTRWFHVVMQRDWRPQNLYLRALFRRRMGRLAVRHAVLGNLRRGHSDANVHYRKLFK